MLASSFFVFFTLLASVVTAGTLYRGDTRGPKTIWESDKGFKARGNQEDHENFEATVFQHVTKTLKRPSRDPYISTSTDIDAAKKVGGNKFLYHLDSDEIEERIIDVAAAYAEIGEPYTYSYEKEFAVEYFIPWKAIKKVEQFRDGRWTTIKFDKHDKRGHPLFV